MRERTEDPRPACLHGVPVGAWCMQCGATARHLDLDVLVDHEGHAIVADGFVVVTRSRPDPPPPARRG